MLKGDNWTWDLGLGPDCGSDNPKVIPHIVFSAFLFYPNSYYFGARPKNLADMSRQNDTRCC